MRKTVPPTSRITGWVRIHARTRIKITDFPPWPFMMIWLSPYAECYLSCFWRGMSMLSQYLASCTSSALPPGSRCWIKWYCSSSEHLCIFPSAEHWNLHPVVGILLRNNPSNVVISPRIFFTIPGSSSSSLKGRHESDTLFEKLAWMISIRALFWIIDLWLLTQH